MAWPLYTVGGTTPTAANNAANTGLYAAGFSTHSFGTRVWANTTAGTVPSAFTASFTQLTQVRKANWEPADNDMRDVTHLLSPFRFKERRGSWGNPGRYQFEFNFTPTIMQRQSSYRVDPTVLDENHRYLIVEDPDGSVHQVYGCFQPPKKSNDVTANENVIEQAFEACGIDYYVKSV
jgi:hypothetical protein